LWSHDGRELFYMTMSGRLMRVLVDASAQQWRAGAPQAMFARSYYRGNTGAGVQYDVTADGKRFLMLKPSGTDSSDPTPASIVVVESWSEELKRLVRTR
jgi:hypothetical protein